MYPTLDNGWDKVDEDSLYEELQQLLPNVAVLSWHQRRRDPPAAVQCGTYTNISTTDL